MKRLFHQKKLYLKNKQQKKEVKLANMIGTICIRQYDRND